MKNLTHKYTSVNYRIAINGGTHWLCEDGYSEYSKRWKMQHEEILPENEQVYGVEQAQAHIKEYYAKQDAYTEQRQNEVLTIEKVTTIVEIVQ